MMTDIPRSTSRVVLRNAFVSVAVSQGWMAYLPIDDEVGDLVLVSRDDGSVRHVLVRDRWTMEQKHFGSAVWLAFPIDAIWHLAPYWEIQNQASKEGVFGLPSWTVDGWARIAQPSSAIAAACAPYRLGVTSAVEGEVMCASGASGIAGRPSPTMAQRIAGSLIGGAVGDALGAFVKSRGVGALPGPVSEGAFADWARSSWKGGHVTSITQLSMFTAEGLLRARMRAHHKGICNVTAVVHHAYLRWLVIQGEQPSGFEGEVGSDGWLSHVDELRSRRGEDKTARAALKAAVGFGSPQLATNKSKGSGAIVRLSPVGLIARALGDDEVIFEHAREFAALTHGHVSAGLAAGVFAVTVAGLVRGETLFGSVDAAQRVLRTRDRADEVASAVDAARSQAAKGRPKPEDLERLGPSHTAPGALAMSLCCSMVATDFADGLVLASSHHGDTDTTTSMTGNLLGAHLGIEAVPSTLSTKVELRDDLFRLAADIAAASAGKALNWNDYPGW